MSGQFSFNPSFSPSGSLSSVIKNPSLNKKYGLGFLWGSQGGVAFMKYSKMRQDLLLEVLLHVLSS